MITMSRGLEPLREARSPIFSSFWVSGQVHAQNAGKPQEHIPLRADLGVQDPVKGGLVQSRKPRDGLDGTGRFTQKLEKVVAKGGAVGFVKELRDGCSAFQTGNGNFGGT